MGYSHTSVLLRQALEGLQIRPDGLYLDATVGGGGHAAGIAERLSTGRLICLDKDHQAVAAAGERLAAYPQATVVQSDYSDLADVLDKLGATAVDGVLMDLGVSSHQLDSPERGFSYRADGPLDMRMSGSGPTAADIVNTYDAGQLTKILWEYGEERCAGAIARGIVRARGADRPFETTLQLAAVIADSMPARMKRDGHPAMRSFQALRIAVNDELGHLRDGLRAAFGRLLPGGRLAVISFHSLEDRLVKQTFVSYCTGCVCPPDFPVCVCGHRPEGRLVNKRPITADPEEIESNPRSHSAKLRVIEKIEAS